MRFDDILLVIMELQKILADHKRWVESDGKEGERANLRKAILQEADLHEVNLQGADLEDAHLSVADLMGTNLRLANLKRADFWMADMKNTILQGAELQGANLSDVTNLTQIQIDSAIIDDATILPKGIHR